MLLRSLNKKRLRNSKGKFRKSHDVWLWGFCAVLALIFGIAWGCIIFTPTESKAVEWVDMAGVKVYTSSDRAPVTMYNSVHEQTDSTPCTAANGKDICALYKAGQNICASNDYPLGTKLTVEGLGDCVVMDRMNRRYTNTGAVDWFADKDIKRARSFGRQFIEVRVYEQN